MKVKDDARLHKILQDMRLTVEISQGNEEKGHIKADALLVKAARICGVPKSIIDAYEDVEKFYA